MADEKLINISPLGTNEQLDDNFIVYVVNPALPEAQRDKKITLGQLKAFVQPSPVTPDPEPTPEEATITHGIASSVSGAIQNPLSLTLHDGRESQIVQPDIPQNNDYWIIELPVGWEITRIEDPLTQHVNLLGSRVIRNGQRYSWGPLNQGSGQTYNITIGRS